MAKEEKSGSAWAVSGMVALLAGRKVAGLGMFARGLAVLEQGWRDRHPNFEGGISERWEAATEFYESTHRNKTNRWSTWRASPSSSAARWASSPSSPYRPAWGVSAGSFAFGWGLNILGHAAFEKNAPAFKDDPLLPRGARVGPPAVPRPPRARQRRAGARERRVGERRLPRPRQLSGAGDPPIGKDSHAETSEEAQSAVGLAALACAAFMEPRAVACGASPGGRSATRCAGSTTVRSRAASAAP